MKAGKTSSAKKSKKEKSKNETLLGTSSLITPLYSVSSNGGLTQQHLNQFMGASGSEVQGSQNFQRPQIIAVSGFPIPGSSAQQQQFYQQIHSSNSSFDSNSVPNQSSIHLQPQHNYQ